MGINDFNIYDIAQQKGKYFSNRTALISKSNQVTYGEFLSFVDSLANGLKREGLRNGDRIAILTMNSIKYLALIFAAAKLGVIFVPINHRFSESELAYVLQDSNPLLFFVEDRFKELSDRALVGAPSSKKLFSMEKKNGVYREFQSIIGEDPIVDSYDAKGNDTFVLIYTAAVEGRPRGAMISHNNLVINCLQMNNRLFLSDQCVHLNFLEFFHMSALLGSMMSFIAGGINIFMGKFDPEVALKLIEQERVTCFFSFPPMLARILENLDDTRNDISSLKFVFGLENPDTIRKLEKSTTAKFWNGYGQTESGIISLSPSSLFFGAAGSLTPLTKIKIADDNGQEVPINELGEILVRGPSVFKGYWKLDSETKSVFRDGWLHTGDLARIDKEGFLWYLGRKPEKELIKTGGENVYPKEVEMVIMEHPKVEEVSVIGVPDPKWGESIKAVCVLKKGVKITAEEIIDFVGSKIARFKKPQYVQFVSSLPKNKEEAIDRQKVKAEYSSSDCTNRPK